MINILAIYSKIISESLLSLYPIFVKKINLPVGIQLWIRLITYVMISLFFVNYNWISGNIFTFDSIELSFINLIHIYSSYEGFLNLDSGVAFSIFNIYPILILLLSNTIWRFEYFFILIGLIFFILSNFYSNSYKLVNFEKINNFYYGFVMIIIAGITEALIFFIIKKIKTDNNWNHLFIGYFFGSIVMSFVLFTNFASDFNFNLFKDYDISKIYLIFFGLLINGIIGSLGYYLRFFSIYKLEPNIYAVLSYFGILMAYFYGILFNNESIDIFKIIGTFFIILSNYLIL